MKFFDLADLPQGPLQMSLLVTIRSRPLRLLLKAGLREGMTDAELSEFCSNQFQADLDDPDISELLELLRMRGWFERCEGRWKTRFRSQ